MAAPMSDDSQYWTIGVVVCLLAAMVGAFFGWLASLGYNAYLGIPLGGLGGLLVGGLWFWRMNQLAGNKPNVSLTGRGTGLGFLAGIASTLLLHAGLALEAGGLKLDIFLIGLFCGSIAGLLLGLFMGLAFNSLRKQANRQSQESK